MSSFESKIMATLEEDMNFIKKKKSFEEGTDNHYPRKL